MKYAIFLDTFKLSYVASSLYKSNEGEPMDGNLKKMW